MYVVQLYLNSIPYSVARAPEKKGSAFFGKRLDMSAARSDSDSLMDYTGSDSDSASGADGAPKRPVSTSNSPSKVRMRGSPGRKGLTPGEEIFVPYSPIPTVAVTSSQQTTSMTDVNTGTTWPKTEKLQSAC